MDYKEFLERKRNIDLNFGIDADNFNENMFDFQKELVSWSLKKGRSAIFADCGLGKTLMQLEWARNITEHTNGNVLILTPLAVSYQTIREGEKFGIEVKRSADGKPKGKITVTNYEKLKYFNWQDYQGVVCDESSILKSFQGVRKQEITSFMRKIPYRLLCTATAAPNDYTELGTSSEALGYLGYIDMLNRFFKNDQNNVSERRFHGKKIEWRLKGHAEEPFWRWVCSWARAVRKPSDLGYNDGGFTLKPLYENEHIITPKTKPTDKLFNVEALNLQEQREERRRTIGERCEKAANLVNHEKPALMWCHLNDEGKTLKKLIPDAVEVSGADDDDVKEEKLLSFINGDTRILITKPKIGGWGLNFQHCSNVVMFPSHSFEQYYQAIRRCWRFGQKNDVIVDIVASEGDAKVLHNLKEKAKSADNMFSRLVEYMNEAISIEKDNSFTKREELPKWL